MAEAAGTTPGEILRLPETERRIFRQMLIERAARQNREMPNLDSKGGL